MIVKADTLTVFRGKKAVVQDISLSLLPGLTCIVGRNGSGKTTLMQALAGLVPFQGKITYGSDSLQALGPRQVATRAAWVSQDLPAYLRIRACDFVLMGRHPHLNWLGVCSLSDYQQAEQAMKDMEVYALRDAFMDELSGGERQKIRLARALCQDTPCIYLDEPTHALDPRSRRLFFERVRQLAAGGRTLVLSTHDLDPLYHRDTRVLGIREGRIAFFSEQGIQSESELDGVYA